MSMFPAPITMRLLPNWRSASCLVLSLIATDAAAQTTITGRVIDHDTGAPIAGASIQIRDGYRVLGSQVAGYSGEFTFVIPAGVDGAIFRARRIGFQEATTPRLWTEGRTVVEIEIRLDPEAVLLAPIEVVAWSARPSPVFSEFGHRLTRGMGSYFTREDIARIRPAYITDVLATVAGVRVEAVNGAGYDRMVYLGRARTARGDCPAQIFVDGMLMNRAGSVATGTMLSLDQVVSPTDVEGIEIYRGLSTVPAEFLNENAHCGVVAVWTRRGR